MALRDVIAVVAIFVLSGCQIWRSDTPVENYTSEKGVEIACAAEVATALREARRAKVDACDWSAIDSLDKARDVQALAMADYANGREVIGYKVTHVPDGDIVGVYIDGMFIENGASINRDQAAVMFPESDILFRISDASINDVNSADDALEFIDQAIPFLELSGPMTWEGAGRFAIPWTATNASARWGVLGAPIDIDLTDPTTRNALDAMRVTLTKPDGSVHGDVVLEESLLEKVPFLLRELKLRGVALEAGQFISLGNFGPPVTRNIAPGIYTVTYFGLTPEPASVSVTIVD